MLNFLLALSVLAPASFAKISGDTYSDPKTGFAISKPSDWVFVPQPKTYGVQLKNDSLMSGEKGILVAFTKKMGPEFVGVAPAADVRQVSVGSKALVDWLEDEMARQKEHAKYYVAASNAIATAIAGKKAAARAAFINGTIINGRDVHVYHVVYIVHSGGKDFLINMDCNEDMASLWVDVFGKIAGTIEVRGGSL